MTASRAVVSTCLAGLVASLLLVGVVSGTLIRHVVQVLPILAAAVVVMRRPDWGAYAAVPIFLFWLFIVVLIWLFLLGISRLANGQYTAIEIVCTMFMAAFAAVGVGASPRLGMKLRMGGRIATVVVFAMLQVAAMWASFLKPVVNR